MTDNPRYVSGAASVRAEAAEQWEYLDQAAVHIERLLEADRASAASGCKRCGSTAADLNARLGWLCGQCLLADDLQSGGADANLGGQLRQPPLEAASCAPVHPEDAPGVDSHSSASSPAVAPSVCIFTMCVQGFHQSCIHYGPPSNTVGGSRVVCGCSCHTGQDPDWKPSDADSMATYFAFEHGTDPRVDQIVDGEFRV
jgi:hypothetical protein